MDTPDQVRERWENLLESLKRAPVRYHKPGDVPWMFTHTAARYHLRDGLHDVRLLASAVKDLADAEVDALHPLTEAMIVAEGAEALPFAAQFNDVRPADPYDPDYESVSPLQREVHITACGDWESWDYDDTEKLLAWQNHSQSVSPMGGALDVGWKLGCAGAARPKKRFTGKSASQPHVPWCRPLIWYHHRPVRRQDELPDPLLELMGPRGAGAERLPQLRDLPGLSGSRARLLRCKQQPFADDNGKRLTCAAAS